MPVVDHNKNLQRFVDVIKADPIIFDSGVTVGKLRSVEVGDPNNMVKEEKPMPYAYVTTPESLQETSPETGTSIPNNVKSVTVEYNIVVIASSKLRTSNSQNQLYELIKNIRNLSELDPLWKDTGGTDPIFVRSIISNVSWNTETRGQLVTSITITILATIGNLFFLTVPGITDPLPLLVKPIDNDLDTIEDILDDELILRDTAVIKSKRTIIAEFESADSIISTLRTIKESRSSASFTITSPSGVEIITAYLTRLALPTSFPTIETTTIQLDVVNP